MFRSRNLIIVQLLCFWPVWSWYIQRIADGSDEPWGVLALATVTVLLLMRGRLGATTGLVVLTSSAAVCVYSLGYHFLPPLARGMIAMTALALTLSSTCYGKLLQPGVLGLLLLSLPVIASIQFYGGFPVRFITAAVTAQVLGLAGYEVQAQGTLLHWLGEMIVVDAPCAGIKMLWAGLYLNFTLAMLRNFGLAACWVSTSFTLTSVFIGNVLRATLLFFTESGIIDAPPMAHQVIGLLSFLLVTVAVLSMHKYLQGQRLCATA